MMLATPPPETHESPLVELRKKPRPTGKLPTVAYRVSGFDGADTNVHTAPPSGPTCVHEFTPA